MNDLPDQPLQVAHVFQKVQGEVQLGPSVHELASEVLDGCGVDYDVGGLWQYGEFSLQLLSFPAQSFDLIPIVTKSAPSLSIRSISRALSRSIALRRA